MKIMDYNAIKKAIYASQRCQRNWDLTKQIPQQDIDLIITAATQCPSKQNLAHYKIHAVSDRELIETIHDNTTGFTINFATKESTTNTQTLANLLLVFEEYQIVPNNKANNNTTNSIIKNEQLTAAQQQEILRDRNMSIGIASGYVNLIAHMLGYTTGYCACFHPSVIKEILGCENDIALMLGIGYSDSNLSRTVHQLNHNFSYPSFRKQEIQVKYYK